MESKSDHFAAFRSTAFLVSGIKPGVRVRRRCVRSPASAGSAGSSSSSPSRSRRCPPAAATAPSRSPPRPSRPSRATLACARSPVASALDRPVHVAFAPGEPDRAYVVEQPGLVRVLVDGEPLEAPFLDIRALTGTSPSSESASEQGLLSLAFASDYPESGLFYVHYTDREGNVNVVEYRARDGVADPGSARTLLLVEKSSPIHNGGLVAVGPDGGLYVGLGDDGQSQVQPQSLEHGRPARQDRPRGRGGPGGGRLRPAEPVALLLRPRDGRPLDRRRRRGLLGGGERRQARHAPPREPRLGRLRGVRGGRVGRGRPQRAARRRGARLAGRDLRAHRRVRGRDRRLRLPGHRDPGAARPLRLRRLLRRDDLEPRPGRSRRRAARARARHDARLLRRGRGGRALPRLAHRDRLPAQGLS